jgi:hypothetical protein
LSQYSIIKKIHPSSTFILSFTFKSADQLHNILVAYFSHALYLLLDILNKIWLFGKLFFVDTLDRVHLVIWRFELYFLNGKNKRKSAFPKFFKGVEVIFFKYLTALLEGLILNHFDIRIISNYLFPQIITIYSALADLFAKLKITKIRLPDANPTGSLSDTPLPARLLPSNEFLQLPF